MKLTVTSQLMPNHVAGAPLAAQKSVAVAYTADRSPLLFALDEALTFAVTLPSADSGTGWEQIDLGAQLAGTPGLGAAPKVQAFAVSQDPDGTIWLAVAAASAATAPSAVFISTGLSNRSTAADWKNLRQHLSARQLPAGLVVSQAVVGSTGDAYPLAVVVASGTDGKMQHLQLNPDPGPVTGRRWRCSSRPTPPGAGPSRSASTTGTDLACTRCASWPRWSIPPSRRCPGSSMGGRWCRPWSWRCRTGSTRSRSHRSL